MKILMVASEAEPYSKTGGLADVIGALPRSLARMGHQVGVVLPRYRTTEVSHVETVFESLTIPVGPAIHFPQVGAERQGGVTFYLVDYPPFFDRGGFYSGSAGDYPDNPQRFMLLSRVAVEIAKLSFRPHVLHAHDWQAAMAPVLLKTLYAADPVASRIPSVFTIHNLGYHGNFDPSVLAAVGLPPDLLSIHALEFHGRVNYLKGGLVFADRLTTVSEGYAREIQTPEYGHGLDGLLRLRRHDLAGVLNGADYRQWDPSRDAHIAAQYSSADLSGKKECKLDLLATYGLPRDDPDRPVIGMVSRFAAQKGFDLLVAATDELMKLDLTLVILGSGDSAFEVLLKDAAKRYPKKFGVRAEYDEALAHKIEAGADMFLMPSRYEPSGLNQMYSLKYGTVPIVRATGGLDDSVEAFDPATESGTGFKFKEYLPEALLEAVRAALTAYQDRPAWRRLLLRGMAKDFSWASSATRYLAVYEGVSGAQALPSGRP